ncbi:unnamed protein product [Bathycoccus prasinos]
MLFLRVFSPWVRSCRSVRFGIFSPRPGLSFSCSPRQSTTSRSFDLALFAFLLLSRLKCVLHFRRVWFSFRKLQSFHTKRKKHISNKMDSEEEKKEDKGEHINLKVKDQDNAEVHFKVKMGTKFKKIFDAFLQRKSLQPGSVRFLFDGERVREDQTPQELDMEDGDSLDVMMEQVGGK